MELYTASLFYIARMQLSSKLDHTDANRCKHHRDILQNTPEPQRNRLFGQVLGCSERRLYEYCCLVGLWSDPKLTPSMCVFFQLPSKNMLQLNSLQPSGVKICVHGAQLQFESKHDLTFYLKKKKNHNMQIFQLILLLITLKGSFFLNQI